MCSRHYFGHLRSINTAFKPLPPHSTCIPLVLQGNKEACFPSCCGLTLAGHWYSLICSIIPLLSRTKDGKYHGKDLMGQDESSLIKQRSHREAKDNKKLTPYFPLGGMSSHLTGSRASVRRVVAPEHKCHSKWHKAV